MAKVFPYRILVVDGNEAVLRATAAILSEGGYQVNTARDGFEALAALRGSVPEVLITELHMAGMSGFELLGVIRKRFPSMAVIVTSAEFTPASLPDGLLADRFIGKGDVPPFELLELIRQLTSEGPLRAQPAKPDVAPAWVPRSGRYVVLTCPACFRSFSVPSSGIEIGKRANETCVHCGTQVPYFLDASVVADRPSLGDALQQRLDSSKRRVHSSREMINRAREMIHESKRGKS